MEKKNNRQILIKVCCVIVSFCLWLYISNWQNPISTYTLKNVSVELINTDALAQSKLTLTPNQKFSVPITIRGTDLEVMKSKASDFTIVADMSVYAVKEGENRIPVQIVHYPSDVNIENTNNMWIDVEIDKTYDKSVSLKVKVQGKPRSGYYFVQPTTIQAEATITGPSKFVNMVSSVVANTNVDNLSKDLDTEVALEPVDKNGKTVSDVTVNPEKLQVTVPIKKYGAVGSNVVPGEKQSSSSNVESKSVGINVLTEGKQSATVDIKSITAADQSIQITGNYDQIKDITTINTEPIDLSKIAQSKTITVKLNLPSGINTLNGNTTENVNINANASTNTDTDNNTVMQKTFSINISVENLPDGFNSMLDNSSVNVTVSGDSTVINAINNGDIKATIDATSFKEGVNNVQPVVTLPQGVKNEGLNPNTINVTLIKK